MACIKQLMHHVLLYWKSNSSLLGFHCLCSLSCSLYHSGVYVGWGHSSQKWRFDTDRSIRALSGIIDHSRMNCIMNRPTTSNATPSHCSFCSFFPFYFHICLKSSHVAIRLSTAMIGRQCPQSFTRSTWTMRVRCWRLTFSTFSFLPCHVCIWDVYHHHPFHCVMEGMPNFRHQGILHSAFSIHHSSFIAHHSSLLYVSIQQVMGHWSTSFVCAGAVWAIHYAAWLPCISY